MDKQQLLDIIEKHTLVNVDELIKDMPPDVLEQFDNSCNELLDKGVINQINIHPRHRRSIIFLIMGSTKVFILEKELVNLLGVENE